MAPSLDSRYDPVSMSACLEDFLQSQAGRPGLQAWRVEGLRALQITVPGRLEDMPSGLPCSSAHKPVFKLVGLIKENFL